MYRYIYLISALFNNVMNKSVKIYKFSLNKKEGLDTIFQFFSLPVMYNITDKKLVKT